MLVMYKWALGLGSMISMADGEAYENRAAGRLGPGELSHFP